MNSGKKRPLKLKSYLKQSHSPSPSCVVLFCIVWLCFVVLFCIVWLCVLLSCSVLCGCVFCCPVLYCVAVCFVVLFCIVWLCFVVLFCIVWLCFVVLFCIVWLCFVVLFCIVWLLGPFSLLFITDWQIVFYLMQDGKRQSAMNSGKNRPLKLVKEVPKTKPQSQSCM